MSLEEFLQRMAIAHCAKSGLEPDEWDYEKWYAIWKKCEKFADSKFDEE